MNTSKLSTITAATKVITKRIAKCGMRVFVCAAIVGMMVGRAQAQAWTPSNTTVAAWYDAADAGTVLTSGSAVTNWLDKSGNGLHLRQGATTNQPATGATINSLNALDFTGDWMATASNPFAPIVSNAFVIAVHKFDATANGTLFSLTGSITNENRWQSHAPYGVTLYFDCGGVGAPNRISTSYNVNTNDVVLASFYCSTVDNVQQVYKNGSILTNDNSGHAVITDGNIMVGGIEPQLQDTTIGEFIIINGTVSAATRQKLEGYLAHKWGLQTNLPANHPFKSEPPLTIFSVTVTAPTNGQVLLSGSSVTATVSVENGAMNYQTVAFYTNGVSAWSTNNTSDTLFTIPLGVLEDGTYTCYATVTDSVSSNATSSTNTFTLAPDTTAPTPDPMSFAINPTSRDSSTVVMTATTAIDALSPPVEYFFTNTVNDSNSGWILGTAWTNSGLTEGVSYGYKVKARDALSNETEFSSVFSAVPFDPTIFWDANGTGAGQSNGAGAWLGVNLWWNGTANQDWVSGSDAIFAGTATAAGAVTLASPTTVNSLTFSPSFTGTYTLGTAGQAITLNNGITKNASSGLVTIISPITLGGSQTWTNNSGNKLQISSFVSTSLGQTLTLAGSGEINFPTTSTGISGSGSVVVDDVYLNLISGGNQAVNSYTGTTTVQNGGEILYYTASPNIGTGNINLNGGILAGYANQGFTRPYGAASGQLQITGGVSGFGVNGSCTINFSNVTSVKWGDATFNPSKFVLGGGVNGGTVTFAEAIDLNGADRTITTSVGGILSGGISTSSGTAVLIKEGAGLLVLSASNTYNGGTTISAGTLRFDTRLSMPATGTVTVGNGAALGVTVAGSGITWGSGTGVAGIAGLTSTANSGEGYGGQTGALVNFDGNSFLDLNVTADVTESNAIGNGTATSIRLIKSGANKLTLSGNNTYSGGTTLSVGTLAVGSTNALGSGTLFLNAGTIQSSDATARTISNAVAIGGDFTVGGTGNLTFSDTGASALGWTRTITVNTGRNATFAQAFSGTGYGITKAGAGTLTLTGANTFTGTTTINAGKIVLNNDGDVTSSTVVLNADNTGLTITGGAGVTSIWNNNGADFSVGDFTNIQVVIDGAGTAGSARITNVAKLIWGRSATSSTILLTNGGQMNVTGVIEIGSPYYMAAGETGDANLTIQGGTATSTFTGNNQTFYIGLGDRNGSNNNDVNVNSGGVLTGIGNMIVGHLNYAQDKDDSRLNKLTVDGTGTASLASVTVGYANVAGPDEAKANVVQVTNGGTLTTSGASYIGRAQVASSIANANTATVTGTGSRWNAGNQAVYVGYAGIAGAVSTGNVLTVSAGGMVTNISTLTVKAANTLSLGVGGQVYAGAVVNAGTLAVALDGSATPACGCLNVSGNLNLNNATLNVTVGATPGAPCVIATYGSLTGAFSVTNLPVNYGLDTSYKGKQIAVKFLAAGTVLLFR